MRARAFSGKVVAFLCILSLSFAATVVVAPLASAATITQSPPTGGTVSVDNSNGFADALNVSGNTGPVTYAQVSSDSPNLVVDGSGNVTVNATLAAGSYTVAGTDSDTLLHSGNWSYTLVVTPSSITQTSPTTGTTTVVNSNGYSKQLNVSGDNGAVTYSQTSSSNANLSVNAAGLVQVGATLSVGSYNVAGNVADSHDDTGSWTFGLTVTGTTLTQTSPTTGTTTVAASSSFDPGSLAVNNNTGAVTYVTTSPSAGLSVSAGGVITTTGTLTQGAYTVSGTDSDSVNDSGNWSYTLTVNPNPITSKGLVQTSPTTGTTTTAASSTFNPGPLTVSNNVGAVAFTATTSSTGLTLRGDQISTTGALIAGHYTISGIDHDTDGDTGTWTYALTVTSAIVQTSPTSGVTTRTASSTFNPGSITFSNNNGPVSFVTTSSSAGLSVSAGGVITTTGPLAVGAYTVSGKDSDTGGDAGTWTYTLTVENPNVSVNFDANGGKGSMAPEHKNMSTALTRNKFTRAGYTFSKWNTAANGSGTDYANGALYPFTAPTTLYAQWRVGKAVTHTVTFMANRGRGAMAAEHENTPTGLTGNRFTRNGFTFAGWNTAPNGSGANFANGATYSFKKSITLYARWAAVKKTQRTVAFISNGGRGAMVAERRASPAALSVDRFTRTGFVFVKWNTAPNGSGVSYANGASYAFTVSTKLYAQWRRHRIVIPPAIPATGSVGPFSHKSSTLSSSLQGQIGVLASTIKSHHDTKIVLGGYGDTLSVADARNESLWAANITLSIDRATSVESYLRQRLTALGVKTYTIAIQGNGAITAGTSAHQRDAGLVIARLT